MVTQKQAEAIKLVLFDVDGVLTDGSIFISEQGEFFKQFNVKDGLAIELLHSHSIVTGVISGKKSPALSKRCEQLGFDIIITGCKNKLPELDNICLSHNVNLDNIAFCGDDVLDLPIMDVCGLGVAPSDAHELVLKSADWIMSLQGGKGMAREFVDKLLTLKTGSSLSDVYSPLMNKIQANDVEQVQQ